MVEYRNNLKSLSELRVLSVSSTRVQLDRMWSKSFDPESLTKEQFHPSETARFIAEQARKMRLAAMKSGHKKMAWMIENLFYEAYALSNAKPSDECSRKVTPCAKKD